VDDLAHIRAMLSNETKSESAQPIATDIPEPETIAEASATPESERPLELTPDPKPPQAADVHAKGEGSDLYSIRNFTV